VKARGSHTSNLQNLGDVPIFLPPYAAKHGQIWNEVPEAMNPGYEGLHPHRLEEYHHSNMSDKSVQGGKPRPLQAWFALASRGYCCGGQGTVKQIRGNVPAKLGHEFRKAKNSGTQRWYSPLSPCRRRFCMERQVEMLQSTVRIAEKNATVIQQHIRGHLWRKRLNMMVAAARLIQQHFRAHWACNMPASWQPLDWSGFAFHEVLGQGGVAFVQKATADGWMVAVKPPRPEFKDEGANADLYHELRMLELSQHPKVVTAYCLVPANPQGLVLELLGPTVLQFTECRPISTRDFAHICHETAETAQALHFLQRQSVVHGNVKPSNVCLSYETEWPCVLKLCDFEVAQELPADGFCAQKVGMVYYWSPEMLASPAQYDCKHDIWSLGVFLSCSSGSAWAFSIGILKEDRDARPSADVVVWLAYRLYNASEQA